MPWRQLLLLLRAGGPKLLSALPKLWPVLLDAKIRAGLLDAGKNLASRSPMKRLHAQVDATIAIAEGYAGDAARDGDEAEDAKAQEWARRGRNLARRLDMPMRGPAARENRRAVKTQLADLQAEMASAFDGD